MPRLTRHLLAPAFAVFLISGHAARAGLLEDVLSATDGVCARVAAADDAKLRRIEASLAPSGSDARTVDAARACIAKRRQVLAAETAAPRPSSSKPPPNERPKPRVIVTPPPGPPMPAPPLPGLGGSPTFSMAGHWSGSCPDKPGLGGALNITVNEGRLTGTFTGAWTVMGRLYGTVFNGKLSAGGGQDGESYVNWTGTVAPHDGRWRGSGTWTSPRDDGSVCGGVWSSIVAEP